jgi:hypothetical protein
LNAREFAEEARRMAKPNMNQVARMWIEGPASVEEWEQESIRVHENQRRLREEYDAKEAASPPMLIALGRA